MLDYRVISIGCLSRHPLWGESAAARTAHATTTLVRADEKAILVDPSLPIEALAARLNERAGLAPQQITDVFLTNFRPAHRRALAALSHAQWWIAEAEREHIGTALIGQLDRETDEAMQQMIGQEIDLLHRCQAAPDKLAGQVDLFPVPGFTIGTCGLLLSLPQATVVIAGDAIATQDHLERGEVLTGAFDVAQARESFAEVIEIADWLIPGHDNLLPNMTRRVM
jgi:glyoxylase-like metal-dependent hydrolase (beta-lactamase superfamily II)